MTILNPLTFPVILESLLASNDLTEEQSKYLMNSWLENKIEPVGAIKKLHSENYVVNTKKAANIIPFTSKINLSEGINLMENALKTYIS